MIGSATFVRWLPKKGPYFRAEIDYRPPFSCRTRRLVVFSTGSTVWHWESTGKHCRSEIDSMLYAALVKKRYDEEGE